MLEKLVGSRSAGDYDLLEIKDGSITVDDEAALSSLRRSVLRSAPDRKALSAGERGEARSRPGDHQLLLTGRDEERGVKPADLLAVLSNDVTKEASLRDTFLKKKKARRPVGAPLPKVEADKITRKLAYEETGKEIAKWDTTVKRQKAQDQVHFPLETKRVQLLQAKDYVDSTEVGTELQKKLAAVLGPKTTITASVDDEANNDVVRLQQLVDRRNKLAKFRAAQSFFEAKMRRKKKIKSKSYHRVMKKERLKQQLKTFEELKETDPEKALGKLDELERLRVEERMSLKHRPTSSKAKWARTQALRAKYDPDARKALAEQLRLSKQLTKKVSLEDSSDEEDIHGRDEETPVASTEDTEIADPWGSSSSDQQPRKEERKNVGRTKQQKLDINPSDFMVINSAVISGAQLPNDVNEADDALDDDEDYGGEAALVAEAFAGDDVVADSKREKNEARGANKPDESSDELPGWGSWGGKGARVDPSRRRRKRKHVRMPSPPPRKDDTLGHVIISEKADAAPRKAQVSELPFPFRNTHDYEASMRMPLGNTWVPETAAKMLRAPRVVTAAGSIITPLDITALVKVKKSRMAK